MEKVCAITFDDLPVLSRYPRSECELDIIVSRLQTQIEIADIPVAGFVNESMVFVGEHLSSAERRYGWLREWASVLDVLGNHTYSHMDFHESRSEDFMDDIVRGEILTRKIYGDDFLNKKKVFRFPYLNDGSTTESKLCVQKFLEDRNYRIVPVTIDSSDWRFSSAYDRADMENNSQVKDAIAADYIAYTRQMIELSEVISIQLFDRVVPQILLLHASSINAYYFSQIVDLFKRADYRFVSVFEAIDDSSYGDTERKINVEGASDWHWYRDKAASMGVSVDCNTPAVPQFVQKLSS